jgi:hypothetical protein
MLTDKELEDIRRKMLELDEETPDWAWSSIQAEIKPKRRWRLFWWLAPALLLVTTTGLYFMWEKPIWNATTPAVIADIPSEQPVSKYTEQENTNSIANPQKPAAYQPSQESSLATKTDHSPVSAPDLAPDKKESLEDPRNTSPLIQQNREKGIPKAIDERQVHGKESNQPKEKLSQISITRGKATLPMEGEGKPAEKSIEPSTNIQHGKYITKRGTKPVNKKLPHEKLGSNKNNAPDKNLLIDEGKESIDRVANEQPGTKQPLETHLNGKKETIISSTNSEFSTDTNSLTSENKSKAPNEISPMSSLIEKIGADNTPDSVSVVTLKTDTTAYEKEIIVTPDKQSTSKEWAIGLFFSPRYAFRIVKPASNDDVYISGLNKRKKSGSERMGYELGLSVNKEISRNLHLESSLAFMQLKENLSYSFSTGILDTLLRQVSADGQQIQVTALYKIGSRQLVSSYAYGGWRLGVTYYFWQNQHRRFNITMNGGVNLLVKGQTKEVINGQESKTVYFPSKENLLEQSNYNLLIGAGYSMRVMQKYELMLMPTLNYFLGSTFKSREPFGLQPYSLGLHVQLKRRLKG